MVTNKTAIGRLGDGFEIADGVISVASVFAPQVTKLLFVDNNRTDSYTADGSLEKPFLTLAAAVAVASSGNTIKVVQGTYVENVTLPDGVCLEGFGANSLTITGDVVVSSGANSSLRYMIINGSLTINADCILIDTYVAGATMVAGTATIQAWNSHLVSSVSGVTALTMTSTGKFQNFLSTISSTGDAPAIAQSAGQIILNTTTVVGGRAASPIIVSTGGTFVGLETQVTNSLGGPAIDVSSSGATATNPNMIDGVIATGNVVCGAKPTVVGALVFVVTGSLTGSVLTYKPASRVGNDSSVAGATVKDALETLSSGVSTAFISLTDAPSSYSGQSGKSVIVNETEDGLEFATVGSGDGTWGSITGTLSEQTDLQTVLDTKLEASDLTDVNYSSVSEFATLPASPSIGDVFEFIGTGTNWILTANTGQYIMMLGVESASGGTISSTSVYDCVSLVYGGTIGGHPTWFVKGSMGVLDVV
jgi:hypothetical protein